MKNVLRLFSYFIIPLLSIGVGIMKYLSASDIERLQTGFIMFTLATLLVVPLFSVFAGLLLLRFSLEKTNDSLSKTNDEIESRNKDFLQSTNILISDTIARSNNYYNLHLHPQKDTLAKFIPGLVDDFNLKIKALSDGHLFENDPSKYQEFCSKVFNLVWEGGRILATSIVNPDIFWEDENTINYLRNNKALIEKKKVVIERFFFVNEENKESSLKAIANNLSVKVKVYIIKEDDIKKKDYIKDCGLVDENIAIESKVDSIRNISKVDVFIGEKNRYNEISTLFDLLKSKKMTVQEYFKESEEVIIKKYAAISFE